MSGYFAYGSNMLEQRLRSSLRTPVRYGIGRLNHYRLDFNVWSNEWKGCGATIVPHENSYVWGAIWDVRDCDSSRLDRQQRVDLGVYVSLVVMVQRLDGLLEECRTYQLKDQPDYAEELPHTRYPSRTYLNTIIAGACQSCLPREYVQYLQDMPSNSFEGPIDFKPSCDD